MLVVDASGVVLGDVLNTGGIRTSLLFDVLVVEVDTAVLWGLLVVGGARTALLVAVSVAGLTVVVEVRTAPVAVSN